MVGARFLTADVEIYRLARGESENDPVVME